MQDGTLAGTYSIFEREEYSASNQPHAPIVQNAKPTKEKHIYNWSVSENLETQIIYFKTTARSNKYLATLRSYLSRTSTQNHDMLIYIWTMALKKCRNIYLKRCIRESKAGANRIIKVKLRGFFSPSY